MFDYNKTNLFNFMKKFINNTKLKVIINNNFIIFFTNTLLVLSITFSFIILSVKFTLFFKPLYYLDINTLNITKRSSLPKNEIKKNYNYIIDYLTLNNTNNFNLPTLPASNTGKIHFQEVKTIFNKLNTLLFFSFIINTIGISIKLKYKNFSFLKYSSLALIFIPLTLLIPFILNFDKSFNIFHELLFKNDYWLFSVKTDPVITILPQEFFYHCSVLIMLLILISSIILKIIYNKKVSNKRV